jgi:hypothetical protein
LAQLEARRNGLESEISANLRRRLDDIVARLDRMQRVDEDYSVSDHRRALGEVERAIEQVVEKLKGEAP